MKATKFFDDLMVSLPVAARLEANRLSQLGALHQSYERESGLVTEWTGDFNL